MTSPFRPGGEMPISREFGVGISVGLAITSDEAIVGMTGGIIEPPAAVLVIQFVSAEGTHEPQIMLSANSMAALHGSLTAWSRRLPVAARDQYDALAAESEARWSAELDAYEGEIFGPRPDPAESSFAPNATLKDSPDPMYPEGDDVPPNAGSAS